MENQAPENNSNNDAHKQTNPIQDYFQFIMETFKKPENVLNSQFNGKHLFGLTNMIIYLVLLVLSSSISQAILFRDIDWNMGSTFDHFERPLAYAIALAILLPVYKTYAEKYGNKFTLNFFIEKLGAIFIVPIVLVIVSIPLNILDLDISIDSWLSSAASTFMYIGIFLISYLYVARNNLKVASIFFLCFYVVYRLILFIF